MAIKRTFNGAEIIKPGAYSKIVVENLTGFPLLPAGVVGIIGEALGGEPHVLDIVSNEQIQEAKARYKSGAIADALGLLASPSFDPAIPNGASKIVIYKTNPSTQSAKALLNNALSPVAVLDLKSKNYGSDENQLSVAVASGSVVDANAKILGTVAAPFILAGAETLILLANGTSYTFTNTLVGGAITQAAMIAELNTPARWAPAKPVIASANGVSRIDLTLDVAVVVGGENDYGSLKVNPASTIDTILGMTGSARGVKGSRILTFAKGTESEISPDLGGLAQINISYVGAGAVATLSIQDVVGAKKLTTATGVPLDNLDITLVDANGNNLHTISSLVQLINANASYVASVLGANPQANVSLLDYVDALEMKNVAANLYSDMKDIYNWISDFSQLAAATETLNVERGLAIAAASLFTGASDGASANLDYANGFEGMKDERINVVVPLISQDIGAVTIASVNALAAAHAAWGWSTEGKSERNMFGSFLGSKQAYKDACKALNSGYASLVAQDVKVTDRFGNLVWKDPWAFACILAGMRAGAEVGEPLTGKTINVNDLRVRDNSWSPKKDYKEMIAAGCTFAEPMDAGGFKVVVGNTTYITDGSFVWNRESVVQAAGYVVYDLRLNLELEFTGNKAKTGTAQAIANFIKARMSLYLDGDIIVGDDDNEGLGYKNLRVTIQGNAAIISSSITPVQGVDFLLPTIYLSDIRQNA
jgi:hypothetical protein